MPLSKFFQKTLIFIFLALITHIDILQAAMPEYLQVLIDRFKSQQLKIERASLIEIPSLPKNQFQIIAKLQTNPDANLFVSRYREFDTAPYNYEASVHIDHNAFFLPYGMDKKELFFLLKKALKQ